MPKSELPPKRENSIGRQVHFYTPDILRSLESSALPKFHAAVGLLRASIEELRDMNGVKKTDKILHDHKIMYPDSSPTVPTLRLWDEMLTEYNNERTPFLIAVEDKGKVVAVCEGRIYPFVYNRDQVKAGTEQPVEEKAIFIEQTGVTPELRGNKEENLADRLYSEVYDLARSEGVTLLIGSVNVQNERSRRVVERQGRQNIVHPPLDDQGNPRDANRSWPHPNGAYIKGYEWDDRDTQGKPIHVILENYTQRLVPPPEV